MDTIRNISQKFVDEEKMPIANLLSFSSLGLTKCVGDIADISYGVGFSGHPYNQERREDTAEFLGDLMFYWHTAVIASGFSWQDVLSRWVASWNVKNKRNMEAHASILEMLRYMKRSDKLRRETIEPTTQTMKPSLGSFSAILSRENNKG